MQSELEGAGGRSHELHDHAEQNLAKIDSVLEFAEALARVARSAAAPFDHDVPDLANALRAAAKGTEQLAAGVRGGSDAVRKGGFIVLLVGVFVGGLILGNLIRTPAK